jgi:endonuclease/exonuclease/phosphatase (EEP) superfamily protein YafD
MMRVFVGGLRVAVWASLGFVLSVLVGVAFGSVHWSFDLMAQFLLPAVVVAGAATLVAAVCRWPVTAGSGLVAVVAAYLTAMPFTAAPAPVAKDVARFKVLLFNVWFRNGRLDDVRKMVEAENADIVVLVETTPRMERELQPLSALYPYRFDCLGMGTRKGGCDITIFARSRLTSPAVKETADPERSPVVQIDTQVAGCRLKMFATHMTRPFPNRPWSAQRAQAEEIAKDVAVWPGAKLVLGDFNAAPWGHVIRTIEVGGNVSVLTGAGGTWPSLLPPQMRIPIDHMLAGPGLTFVSRQVLPKIGSDHLPVVGEIAVTDPSQCG